MNMTGRARANFVEMQTDGQMAAWRAALATLAIVIERYQHGFEREDLTPVPVALEISDLVPA